MRREILKWYRMLVAYRRISNHPSRHEYEVLCCRRIGEEFRRNTALWNTDITTQRPLQDGLWSMDSGGERGPPAGGVR